MLHTTQPFGTGFPVPTGPALPVTEDTQAPYAAAAPDEDRGPLTTEQKAGLFKAAQTANTAAIYGSTGGMSMALFQEAAKPRVVLALLAENAALLAKEQPWGDEPWPDYLERQREKCRHLEARAERAEARLKEEQAVTGQLEVEKLALLRQIRPLAFPANQPPESGEQYFCLVAGNPYLQLLLWLEDENDDIDGPVWQEWDEGYYPTSREVVAFWLHPLHPTMAEKREWLAQQPAPSAGACTARNGPPRVSAGR